MSTADGAALLHRLTLAVRWGDMDALVSCNTSSCALCASLPRARKAAARRRGRVTSSGASAAGSLLANTDSGPVIVTTSCEFRQPLAYPATVTVEVYAAPPGRSSVDTHYRLLDAADGRLYALGTARIVWVDRRTGRSTPLPDTLREALPAGE